MNTGFDKQGPGFRLHREVRAKVMMIRTSFVLGVATAIVAVAPHLNGAVG